MPRQDRSGKERMMLKLLFGGSVLFFYLGFIAREGNLFYFFATYLLIGAIGLYFRNREAKQVQPKADDMKYARQASSEG
jgi:hypothetical protein